MDRGCLPQRLWWGFHWDISVKYLCGTDWINTTQSHHWGPRYPRPLWWFPWNDTWIQPIGTLLAKVCLSDRIQHMMSTRWSGDTRHTLPRVLSPGTTSSPSAAVVTVGASLTGLILPFEKGCSWCMALQRETLVHSPGLVERSFTTSRSALFLKMIPPLSFAMVEIGYFSCMKKANSGKAVRLADTLKYCINSSWVENTQRTDSWNFRKLNLWCLVDMILYICKIYNNYILYTYYTHTYSLTHTNTSF